MPIVLLILYAGLTFAAQGAENCADCHAQQTHKWQMSDHANSMALATPDKVKGQFNQTLTAHWGETFQFYRHDRKFRVKVTSQGSQKDYEISYTFGHFPLQQYLVETGKG